MALAIYYCRILTIFKNTASPKYVTACFNPYRNGHRFISQSAVHLSGRKYTDKHEWVDGNSGKVGITHYAQDALGDIVYAQLPEVGTVLKALDECGALESVKAASELFSPASGKVLEKNTEVEDNPSLINSSCYEKGWLFRIELSNPAELESLLNEDDYNKFVKSLDE